MILVKFFDFCSHSVPLPCVIVTTQSQAYFFLTGSLTLRAPSSFELSACPAQDVESQMLGGRLMPLVHPEPACSLCPYFWLFFTCHLTTPSRRLLHTLHMSTSDLQLQPAYMKNEAERTPSKFIFIPSPLTTLQGNSSGNLFSIPR